MKVVGSGAPRTLTVRLQPCEFGAWREELHRRLAVASERSSVTSLPDPPAGPDERDGLVLLGRLLDRAHEPVAAGQPRVLAGPTWLLAHVIRTVAVDAMERYVDAGRAFCEGQVRPSIDEVRAALDTATAATATAIALERAETDAHDRPGAR